jgi:hypothetical protein
MNWILAHWQDIVMAAGGIVMTARVIVKLTPTPKDDSILEKIIAFLSHLGLKL